MSAAPGSAAGPIEAVQRYLDAFNKGDVEGMSAMCATPMQILDGMAPHVWQGPTASADWYRDVLIEGQREQASGYVVSLGTPRHVDVRGEHAYVVAPATMKFTAHGKHISQSGATFTVALQKSASGWRLRAWAWSKGTASVQP